MLFLAKPASIKKNDLNEFLTNVKEDYKEYYDYIVQEKQRQLSALILLKEYLNDLVKTEKVVDNQIKRSKYDQTEIENEINKVKIETNNA